MIERDLANVSDLALFRPVRQGPSLDTSATSVTLATGLTAIYEPKQRLIRDITGREIAITSVFWIDPVDNDGVAIEVRAHDHLQWTDYRGVLQKRQLILVVSPWYCGAELDHIKLEIG